MGKYRSPREKAINSKMVKRIDKLTDKIKEAEETDLFKRAICDAILIQFKEPKIYDLTIPDAYNIYSLFVIAGKIMNGQKIKKEKVDCVTTNHSMAPLRPDYFSKLSKRVYKGIFEVLNHCRGEPVYMEQYLNVYEDVFGHEWHCGWGDWYRFRNSEKEKAEKRVEDYFGKKEISDFNNIGEIIQPYIRLTNSAAKCK